MLQVRVTSGDGFEHPASGEAAQRLQAAGALDLAGRGPALLAAVVAEERVAGARAIELAVSAAGDVHDAMAAAAGLALRREVLRLGRDLPVGEADQKAPAPRRRTTEAPVPRRRAGDDVTIRSFRVGHDEDEWLRVNNRAFAWHPDQGGWTRADIEAREAEPWFDPDGFLVHERDGRIAAFCWTKVHDDEHPPLGEIYVIGVDPDAAGAGLGRALTLAGLDHLARHGLRDAILYVESTNTRARALYDHLGFTVVWADRWWRRDL